eukprot:GHVL01008935.1.p1 GENE.GHVL01008935.1~~GHVL01008935.1.p1  ORF type:complete len:239 (+),score=4.51 GHVL01008935.1:3-719(+)
MYPGECLTYHGDSVHAGDYTWYHLDYNGKSVWAASKWLTTKTCGGSTHTGGGGATSTDHVQLPGCPRIVRRAEWGARAPKHHTGDMAAAPIYVFIHHSGAGAECFDQHSCSQKVRVAQDWYMDGHGWSDLGYNFMVGEDGNAYEVRGWTEIGAHTLNYNHNGIAICVIGDFTNKVPNTAALNTVKQLIECGLKNHHISPSYTLKGHRDVGTTACPGTAFYNLIHSWPHYASGTNHYAG